MSTLEITINREVRRAQVFRARFHAALGDNQPLEDIPTDDLETAAAKLQTRARQGDPNGWAWVHAELAKAELIRRQKSPVENGENTCGKAGNAGPGGILEPTETAPASVVRATQEVPGPNRTARRFS
jgi:hypothetical protein